MRAQFALIPLHPLARLAPCTPVASKHKLNTAEHKLNTAEHKLNTVSQSRGSLGWAASDRGLLAGKLRRYQTVLRHVRPATAVPIRTAFTQRSAGPARCSVTLGFVQLSPAPGRGF